MMKVQGVICAGVGYNLRYFMENFYCLGLWVGDTMLFDPS